MQDADRTTTKKRPLKEKRPTYDDGIRDGRSCGFQLGLLAGVALAGIAVMIFKMIS